MDPRRPSEDRLVDVDVAGRLARVLEAIVPERATAVWESEDTESSVGRHHIRRDTVLTAVVRLEVIRF